MKSLGQVEIGKLLEKLRASPDYAAEGLVLDVVHALGSAMKESGVSRAELSRRLGTSRAFVSQFFNAPHNMTLETVAKIAHALGLLVSVDFLPRQSAQARGKANVVWYRTRKSTQDDYMVRPGFMEPVDVSMVEHEARCDEESEVKPVAAAA